MLRKPLLNRTISLPFLLEKSSAFDLSSKAASDNPNPNPNPDVFKATWDSEISVANQQWRTSTTLFPYQTRTLWWRHLTPSTIGLPSRRSLWPFPFSFSALSPLSVAVSWLTTKSAVTAPTVRINFYRFTFFSLICWKIKLIIKKKSLYPGICFWSFMFSDYVFYFLANQDFSLRYWDRSCLYRAFIIHELHIMRTRDTKAFLSLIYPLCSSSWWLRVCLSWSPTTHVQIFPNCTPFSSMLIFFFSFRPSFF